VLTLLSDVANGMAYLHSRNCVHGDLKPANVLLRRSPNAPFGHAAKVADFGLTK
jgi:serine/threonine protein kinase